MIPLSLAALTGRPAHGGAVTNPPARPTLATERAAAFSERRGKVEAGNRTLKTPRRRTLISERHFLWRH